MEVPSTANVKYIYLDVVGFTLNRSSEAQAEIIKMLNGVVKRSLWAPGRYIGDMLKDDTAWDRMLKWWSPQVPELRDGGPGRLLFPSGDGLCIALVNFVGQFDIHLQIARSIVANLADYNQFQDVEMRQFEVRIGLSENDDILVRDINERVNVAGDGINTAQRVMSLGDGGNILVHDVVYRKLHVRDDYFNPSIFRGPLTARIKHDRILTVYQYLEKDLPGLNNQLPGSLARVRSQPRTKLVIESAMYGAQDRFTDVTEIVRQRIHKNQLEIRATNEELGGDPIVGAGKVLTVVYKYGGTETKISINENEVLKLPESKA